MDFSKFCVYLRAFEIEDFKTTHLWRGDEEIIKSVVGRKYFVSQECEKKWINDAIFTGHPCDSERAKHAYCSDVTAEALNTIAILGIHQNQTVS